MIKREKFIQPDNHSSTTIGMGFGNLWNDMESTLKKFKQYDATRKDKIAVSLSLIDIPDMFSFDEPMYNFYTSLGD